MFNVLTLVWYIWTWFRWNFEGYFDFKTVGSMKWVELVGFQAVFNLWNYNYVKMISFMIWGAVLKLHHKGVEVLWLIISNWEVFFSFLRAYWESFEIFFLWCDKIGGSEQNVWLNLKIPPITELFLILFKFYDLAFSTKLSFQTILLWIELPTISNSTQLFIN